MAVGKVAGLLGDSAKDFSTSAMLGMKSAEVEQPMGLGRTLALHRRSPAAHQTHRHIRCLCF
jgi:hypothetical protein